MSETRRWRIDLAYDGAAFHGWAAQRDLRTVQGELEHWITMVLRLDSPAELTVAGRTDAGVHARGQVAHLDLSPEHDATHLAHRLARVLPADVVIHRVVRAAPGFDARSSAIWRRYVYRLWDRDSAPDPLLRNHHTLVTERLDVAAMDQAAGLLVGLRDFAPFCRHRDRATTSAISPGFVWPGSATAGAPSSSPCRQTPSVIPWCCPWSGPSGRWVADVATRPGCRR